ncbi:ATP-binding protein [Teredinibacter turnerae]|uniref:sensor histidine kinase n=1 Tax=Teredinibacter turnerae TaxID=2426 RepID=UPI00035D9F2A|nr:ATP-binding protein [Teredinibacter turnerae]
MNSATLYRRMATWLLVTFVLITVLLIVIFTRASRGYQQEITQRMHRDLADFVADHYLLFDGEQPNLAAIEHTFHDLMILGPNFEFYLLDPAGQILAYSADPQKIKRHTIAIAPLRAFSSGPKDKLIYGDDPRSLHRHKIFSAAPIYNENQQLAGYLYVILGSEIYEDIASMVTQSKIMHWALWLIGASLGLALLTMLWLTRVFTRPLARLTQQVTTIQATGFGRFDQAEDALGAQLQEWNGDSQNEIDKLGSAFAQLLNTLNQQYTNVLTVDQLRKELLSHVSHDLRTPLASLMGYLETWEIQRGDLSEKQSTEYIAIARKSAERISHLVEQLFELAHLDSGTVQVNREPFSLPELVQDVLQKFQISANDKQVTLGVTPNDSHIRVVGDIEKLERVFTNLVENALRHTNAGGSITVRLKQDTRFVAVEVVDTGVGIPEADVPFVFDPHFKAGNSVRGNTAHGGLGLAITKKLLDLHHAHIEVRSQLDLGTTFQFELEAA